jgi:arginine decarboxylase
VLTPRRIPVVTATGRGATELAAFDAALVSAGVADRNLLCLSSVLPPGSVVDRPDRIRNVPGDWGDRLYVVLAEARTSVPGREVWAGIGWVQDATGRGLLVEHHAGSEQALKDLIDMSLTGLLHNRAGMYLPDRGSSVVGVRCERQPVCALTVAVFKAEPW